MTVTRAYFFGEPNVSPRQLYVYQCVAKLLRASPRWMNGPCCNVIFAHGENPLRAFDASVNNGVGIVRSGLPSLIIQQHCTARVNG